MCTCTCITSKYMDFSIFLRKYDYKYGWKFENNIMVNFGQLGKYIIYGSFDKYGKYTQDTDEWYVVYWNLTSFFLMNILYYTCILCMCLDRVVQVFITCTVMYMYIYIVHVYVQSFRLGWDQINAFLLFRHKDTYFLPKWFVLYILRHLANLTEAKSFMIGDSSELYANTY